MDFTAYHMLAPLLRHGRDEGFEMVFACSDGPWAATLRSEGFEHWAIPASRRVSPGIAMAILVLALRLRRAPPDLIHSHTPAGGIVGRTAALLSWSGPLVHTFHGLPFEPSSRSRLLSAYLALERLLTRRTTFFLSQGRADARRAVQLGIARANEMLVIGNGVDVSRFAPSAGTRSEVRRELGLHDDDILAIMVARLVREKGVLELAGAAATADPRLNFVLLGDALPSDRTSVIEDLSRHPVARQIGHRWRVLGHRPDVNRYLAGADIFVLPTYREGLPRSVIEAMAAGLAIVTTRIPACEELVTHGANGLLVPVRDVPALQRALDVLAADRELRHRMGQASRIRAVQQHDERRIVAVQTAKYRELVA